VVVRVLGRFETVTLMDFISYFLSLVSKQERCGGEEKF
jgi:hypothetical protein